MATILLQAAGTLLGGLFGPIGAVVGRAVGALAGYSIDRALIDGTRRIEGPRLSGARPFSAEEGVPIPRLYGTVRVGGTLIWATRFEESKSTKRQGFKGGPRVTEYSYFANVAFALCEGEVAGIRRVWADGREVDRNTLEFRLYRGGEDQMPDPLIEAKHGEGNAPAYRGLAYVVLERMAIGDYGNRIPQMQFEVMRPVGGAFGAVRAVALIPGSTEYGLSPQLVTQEIRRGETVAENRHVLHGSTDLVASLDELQALCPNLTNVALVATWFGDDLRAGHCRIRPAVTTGDKPGLSQAWRVSGVSRDEAMVVSGHGGGSAYGGSPTDRSVIAAIEEIKSRGLNVTLYPFVMMDVPADNGLPDPYGGDAQAAYPWRGRITCDPAPGRPGTADKTVGARAQVEAFCGSAATGDFAISGGEVVFSGGSDDWGYRRFLLHFAHLAVAAGGVDAFLIGSELRGLTTLRDEGGAFPFVEALCTLADEAHAILGGDTAVSYGADWSEYFGHQPADGSGDVFFHLDPLWARPSVAAVGIDNYMPLADWRDGDAGGNSPDGAGGPYDAAALRSAITGGEGFDWYYPSMEARIGRERAPIGDGAHGKPWVFRYKDLAGWWSNPHHDRPGGVELPTPTDWIPSGKPIWFTELGCPAIDKGPNQPNVFPDPKSAENAIPHFSDGGRSDLAMLRFLEAHAEHWEPPASGLGSAGNPLSPVYGGAMVDPSRIYAWSWDARPFPAFPQRNAVWADGGNWHRGHWLNGRIGGPDLGSLINAILADHGEPPADVSAADGTVHGYVLEGQGTAREALEPLVALFDLAVSERADGLEFRSAAYAQTPPLALDALVLEEGSPVREAVREPDHDLPAEAVLMFQDPMAGYQIASARAVRTGGSGRLQTSFGFPGVLEPGQGASLAAAWLDSQWASRDTVAFAVAPYRPFVEPGALVALEGHDPAPLLVTQIEDGTVRRVKARRLQRAPALPWAEAGPSLVADPLVRVGKPRVMLLDLPARTASGAIEDQLRIAAWQKPWKSLAVYASPETTGFSRRATLSTAADVGMLAEALEPGFAGRVHRAGMMLVDLADAEAESVSRLQLLNGANAAAVRSATGAWEVLQFETAEEVEAGRWRLTGLLRGQLGTDDAMRAGAAAGADFVMLNDGVVAAGLQPGEIGLPMNWRVAVTGQELAADSFAALSAVGGLRARLPLSPVHVKCRKAADGSLNFSWVRRGRLDADDWSGIEIPLGEEQEAYVVSVSPADGDPIRTAELVSPGWTYAAAAIAEDFGALPPALDLTVRQMSASAGYGVPATRRFTF